VKENVSLCTVDHKLVLGEKSLAAVKELPVGQAVTTSLKLSQGGGHMFTLINCATADELTISGKIRVKSSWGYLDALDYYKMPIYACALVVTAILVLIYSFAVLSQEDAVRDTQYYCLLLGLMCFAEAAVACGTLYMENEGNTGWGQMVEALYLAKLMYGLTFIMQTVQGLGFTQHRLDWVKTAKCYVVVLLYVLAAMPKISFYSIRPHLALVDGDSVLKSTAPVIGVSCLLLCWVICSLGNLIRELRKRDDGEALAAAKRCAGLFLFLMVSAAFVLVGQLANSGDVSSKSYWSYTLWNDAFASGIFTATIATMMWFSMENYIGKSLQMGALPTNDDDDLENKHLGAAASDEENEAIFGKGPPGADTIGAPDVE